jgi:hypothetical protein
MNSHGFVAQQTLSMFACNWKMRCQQYLLLLNLLHLFKSWSAMTDTLNVGRPKQDVMKQELAVESGVFRQTIDSMKSTSVFPLGYILVHSATADTCAYTLRPTRIGIVVNFFSPRLLYAKIIIYLHESIEPKP